ncbi:HXXEE domain-containing protein [Brachybacterium sp. EF45031]|uniref:HXXEE domain-containing protein n=1 Tax=Brachybacterium sillae TaxID=2810536 RepID=UPI00217D29C1|nr:HXXEE domain-containing protein [Brachybacterium sillae]MCS6710698.1 HXXEE domain-containing protein [Brachybacterium sillae]
MVSHERGQVLALLGIFALHNVEEIIHLPRDRAPLPVWAVRRGPWADTPSYAVATGLLTVAVSAASIAGIRAHGLRRGVLLGGPSAALLGNAASHMARALLQRHYNGGLATAPAMALLAGRVFASGTRSIGPSAHRCTFIAANLAAVPAIIGALLAGRVLTRMNA